MRKSRLPKTPSDLFQFSFYEYIIYNGLITLFRLLRCWSRPAQASGDIETMTYLDKVYWLYKTRYPIRLPEKCLNSDFLSDPQTSAYDWPSFSNFKETSRLSISSAGDLISHPYLSKNKDLLYAQIDHLLFDSDISMANLECPIITSNSEFVFNTKQAPSLFFTPEAFAVVRGHKDRSFTFLATACNHSLDFGETGIRNTLDELHTYGISYNGTNIDRVQSSEPTVIIKKNIAIGIIAHTFGSNGHKTPENKPWLLNQTNLNDIPNTVDLSRIKLQLDQCWKKKIDFVIAHLHWGYEHEYFPRNTQVDLAHRLAELGVDAIFGHHPHVIQPIEYYRTHRDPKRVVPIYYSLGNLTNSFTAPHLTLSMVARLMITKGTFDGQNFFTYVLNADNHRVKQIADEETHRLQLVPSDNEDLF